MTLVKFATKDVKMTAKRQKVATLPKFCTLYHKRAGLTQENVFVKVEMFDIQKCALPLLFSDFDFFSNLQDRFGRLANLAFKQRHLYA